jgi:Tol biopolymer transport system component/predicted Ser/Thr protein kinase
MSLSTGTRLGSYEVTGQLGVGGMGEVYRATDTRLGREVAIKTLPSALAQDPGRLARFEREAKLLAALNHAHIGAIYGLDEHEGTQFIAMELVEGQTLEEKLKDGPLPVEDALHIALQIAEALEAAHDKGVVHRDLKPANIMLTRDGVVKVLDFGLAKAFAGDPNQASPAHSPALSVAMTQQGLILGTAGYMSPEQASGQATDQRADIWAFGVVLYEMLTGMPLFSGESVPHVLAAVLQTEPDWNRLPKHLHPRLKLLLERCLKKKVRDRYHSIADVRVEIEDVLRDPESVAAAVTARPMQPGWRRAIPVAAALVIGSVLAGVAAWSLWPSTEARPVNRYVYDAPSDLAFRNTGRPVIALSPTGRHFAFNSTAGIYLRRLDELEARVIPGTEEGSIDPFFSPDGQSIAYYDGALKRIGINGGAPVVIASDVSNLFGASWESDGSILFGQPEGIFRVSADSGSPELVIPARDGEQVYGPQLLPDADSVLFSVAPPRIGLWDTGQIVVESLATGERRVLVQGGSDGRYLPTGHIVYAFENKLFAVAFDVDSLTVSGEPVPLVQDVARTIAGQTGAAQFAFSRDGTLIYSPEEAIVGSGEQMLVWVDRSGREEDLGVATGAYSDLSLSPDTRRVVLSSAERNLWIWDFESKVRTRLSLGGTGGDSPVWTPDGTRIAYHTSGTSAIAWRAANNTGVPEVLIDRRESSGLPLGPCFFSPDGTQLVFVAQTNPGNQDIGLLTIGKDAEPTWLLHGQYSERNAELSPNGRWMAYESDQSGQREIYVRPFPNVDENIWLISNGGGMKPIWSRDGQRLYYLEPVSGALPRLMSVSVESDETTFSFSERKSVLDWPYRSTGRGRVYDVSQDGEHFLAMRAAGRSANTARIKIVIVENWFEELERLAPPSK